MTINADDLKNKMAKKLAEFGVEITPASTADRRVTDVAAVSAKVVNGTQRALHDLRREAEKAAETARSAIHEATRPKPPKAD
jgi:C4-type Zn-finger protein